MPRNTVFRIFLISKNKETSKKEKLEYKKAKEIKQGKRMSPENRLKK